MEFKSCAIIVRVFINMVDPSMKEKVELGTQVYFHTCEITDTLSVIMTHSISLLAGSSRSQ